MDVVCYMKGRKGVKQILLVSIILTTFLITPVYSTNQQGLSWAIDVGDEFNYTLTREIDSEATSERIVVRIEELRTLPDMMNDSWYNAAIGSYHVTYLYENGTEFPHQVSFIAVAIGNWTLLSEVLLEDFQNTEITIIDDSQYWGYTKLDEQMYWTYKFSKEDGVISYYYHESSQMDWTVRFVRDGYAPESIPIQLQVVVSIVVAAVIVIVVWWRMKD